MTTPSQCFSLVRGRAMRVTALDGCGRPVNAACATLVSDGFISVAFTAQTDAGTAISVQNAAGKTCIQDTPCPVFNGYTVEIQFCEVNPLLLALVSGQGSIFDPSGTGAGFTVNSDVSACDSGFALELWSNVPGIACDPEQTTAQGTFGYVLVPFLQGGSIGDFTIQNDAVNFTVSGAATKTGSGWKNGPYNVVMNGTGPSATPGPLLEPIKNGDHLLVQLTTVAPPEPSCDCISKGNEATSANEGAPGTFPTDTFAPFNLAAAIAIPLQANDSTGTPSTGPWASGSFIVLGDRSRARWDGTTWVAA